MTIPRYIHLQADYVHPHETEASLVALSQYITRAREVDVRDRSPVVDAASYMLRREQHALAQGEVAGHAFFCDGRFTALEVWRDVDAAARTKSGEYSKRGGRRGGTGNPRLAIFMDASLPLGIAEDVGIAIAHAMARLITAKYGAAVEVVCHKKDGRVDHAHFLISMRRVDISGVHEMIREFNGVASRLGPDAVGDERLSAHMEWMRAEWARLLTGATGILHDPRSYKRQRLKVQPLSHVPRSRIEIEKRNGVPAGKLGWRQENALKLSKRSSIHLPEKQSASFESAGFKPPIRSEVPPIVSISAVTVVTDRKDPPEAGLDGATLPRPAAWQVDQGRLARARAQESAIAIDRKQTPSTASPPQVIARGNGLADGPQDGRKPNDDGHRTSLAALSTPLKILSEGAPETVFDKAPFPVAEPMPPSRPNPLSSDDPSRERTITFALILFGTALLKSRQWTTDNVERLASAAGMERSRFEEAIKTTAERMPDISPASIRIEAKAQVGAARADLLHLMEDIERDRAEAKAAARKKRKGDLEQAKKRRAIEGRDSAATPIAHGADPVAGPVRTADSAERSAPRTDGDDARPTVAAGETSDIANRILEARQGSEATPAQSPSTKSPPRHQEIQSRPQPISSEDVDTILDLAAFLAWRGRLQEHLPAISKICRMAVEEVLAEIRLRLQALAQMKTPLKDLWSRTLIRARASENPTIAAFVDAITTVGTRKPSKIERPEPATTDKDIKTRQ